MGRAVKSVLLFLALLGLSNAPAGADVVKITVKDTIQPVSAEYIGRAIDRAAASNASAVLIQLETPGGTLDATRDIVSRITTSKAPVIVFVSPAGSRAASAGFFILESADVAAMAPGTNTGAAHPVAGNGAPIDPVMSEKIANDAAAFMRSYLTRRGRNATLAETAVRKSVAWSDQEALDQHLIDVIAKDDADLMHQLDGRTITRFDGSKQTLHLAGQKIVPLEMTTRLRTLDWLMDPNISYILLTIGLLCIYVEFNHPGAILPGVIGFVAVALAIFAMNLLPIRFAALGLVLAAFVLFALEAKFVSHGVLTTGGILLLVVGGLLLIDGPIPEMRVKLITALGVAIPLGLITAFLMSIAYRARRNKVSTGVEGLIGEIGTVRSPLLPRGKVFVHGSLWDAVAPAPLPEGSQVRVTDVDGLLLKVEQQS
ncbi:MAG: nodulation protein NfeD [Acidobacteriaceae bacterium]